MGIGRCNLLLQVNHNFQTHWMWLPDHTQYDCSETFKTIAFCYYSFSLCINACRLHKTPRGQMHHGYSWLVCLHDTKHPDAWIIWRPCLTRIFNFHWDRLLSFRLKQSKCFYQFLKDKDWVCALWRQLKQRKGRREGGRMNRVIFVITSAVWIFSALKEGVESRAQMFNCPRILKGAVQIILIIPINNSDPLLKLQSPHR